MNNLTALIEKLPPLLARSAQKKIEQFIAINCEHKDWFEHLLNDSQFASQLLRTWSASQYAADLCLRCPTFFQEIVDNNLLQKSDCKNALAQRLQNAIAEVETAEQLSAILRQCRAKEMLRIIWRDINRLADLKETTNDISNLADSCIEQANHFFHKQLCAVHGTPTALINGVNVEQQLVVLGMGKLGACELNLSSDIDLIFSYPEHGETQGGPVGQKPLDNHEFFTRLGRKLIQSLDQITVDGFVFRVDMRLRPYGESGALVLSFDAMEEYYQSQGREWERYAMVKARPVAGSSQEATRLMSMLRPFTYRRYIDFSVIDSLRTMKKMIRQEVKRRGLENDVKLSAGGIREIEFIAQTFQLIRGGREHELQERSVVKILALLAEKQYLPRRTADELLQAYDFLRNTEHAIQAFHDRQTQTLPTEDYARSALVLAMGFTTWNDFIECLEQHRKNVSYHFQQVIADGEEEVEDAADTTWTDVWQCAVDDACSRALLEQAGHEQADVVLKRLVLLRESQIVKRMQNLSKQRLDQFMPLLLQAVIEAQNPSATLIRILPLVESVLRRTAYLVLLEENHAALQQLIILCAASPWVATQLTLHPALLDELLDARALYAVPDKRALRDDLQQQMLRVNWDDLESHMEGLRYFKLAHQLRVTAAEIAGHLPLMKVSDYLTMIAEVVLEYVLEIAWHNLVEKHGRPQQQEAVACDKGFIIAGYGKLGGIELGHSSDLDLVFIHNGASNMATDGEQAVDNSVFFSRLGQRIIHILTAQTPMGQLYDVDMRLRPSGESGLLVSSIIAFSAYQEKSAWTWEHQALVRARVVAGDSVLAEQFSQVRRNLLQKARDIPALKIDAQSMRQKMRDHLAPAGLETAENPFFDLKHGRGAIVDLEFMVQYAVLAWAQHYPSLTEYTDNIRILEALAKEGLFSEEQAQGLIVAYKEFRSQNHRLSLQQLPAVAMISGFEQHRIAVQNKWNELFAV